MSHRTTLSDLIAAIAKNMTTAELAKAVVNIQIQQMIHDTRMAKGWAQKALRGSHVSITALAEMFGIPDLKITKDALYESAKRLWNEHRGLEDWLHDRVCSMFGIEEKILLFDITNSYFEGKMENSELCQYGRSKEKRDDCRIVVLAAVVNTEGLLVRTMIYEGNHHDSTTVEEVVGTLTKTTTQDTKRIVVMDAGFYSNSNVNWLKANGFDYITVLPSGDSKFESTSLEIIDHTDNKGQQIRLQIGKVDMDGESVKTLMVDSDAKGAKERSMYEQACKRYEEGLEAIKKVFLPRAEPRNVTP